MSKWKKSKLFTGTILNCYEFNNVEDFMLLPQIGANETTDYMLKNIGNVFSKRKSTNTLERICNLLNAYCKNEYLNFSVSQDEIDLLKISIGAYKYIFGINSLKIITPYTHVTNYEIKE